MLKPLKDLIAEADRYLGQTKISAPVVSDEVSSLADTLAFASHLEEQFSGPKEESTDVEFEKVAKAINKIAASAELEVLIQSEQFALAAKEYGYTDAQISEALTKVSSKKVHKNLAALAAMGVLSPSKEDLNSLNEKVAPVVSEAKRVLPATMALRGAM